MDERTRKKVEAVTGDDFSEWHVADMPWVKKEPSGGSNRDVDHMLTILDRRLRKSGRLDEYRERQYYTKPSEERRQARQEREYKLQKLKERGNANTDSRS